VARFTWEQGARTLDARQVIIVDEASMIGVTEMWRILRRLGEASLVLVGDPVQLPPVTPGPVFHILVAEAGLPKAVLQGVLRQSAASGIPAVAGAVRAGRLPDLPEPDGAAPGVSLLPGASGEPVIRVQNAPGRGLTNGALGQVVRVDADGIVADLDGTRHVLSGPELEHLDLAYAITVHKAQGSQRPRVLVAIGASRALDRALVYTAMTRATDQVVLLGDAGAARRAVEAMPQIARGRTGLARWLDLARGLHAARSAEAGERPEA